MGRVLTLLRPYRRYLGQALLVSLLLTLLSLPGPYVTKVLLDDAYPHQDYGLMHFLLAGVTVLALLLAATQAASDLFGRQVGLTMSLDVQTRLLRHVQSLELAFFDQHQTGEILARFDDLEASVSGTVHIASSLFVNGLQLLVFP